MSVTYSTYYYITTLSHRWLAYNAICHLHEHCLHSLAGSYGDHAVDVCSRQAGGPKCISTASLSSANVGVPGLVPSAPSRWALESD